MEAEALLDLKPANNAVICEKLGHLPSAVTVLVSQGNSISRKELRKFDDRRDHRDVDKFSLCGDVEFFLDVYENVVRGKEVFEVQCFNPRADGGPEGCLPSRGFIVHNYPLCN